ncbi:MAG TPA: glycosyltransferase family 2 protein, partial [Terriglobales bacterium]|nr:glycosyltransferase family 2 protein [Terriglobales bacterium]
MYREQRVAVVMPCYNESAMVADVIRGIPPLVDHIFVVDDCSPDNTAAAAGAVGDPRVDVTRHQRNQGVGGATLTGFRKALERGADLVVKIDGDGQMDPSRLPALLDPLVQDGYEYTKGNRFLHSDELRQMPVPRLLGNFALTFLTKLASGYWHIFDPQNGYVAIRAGALRALDLDRVARDFFFENDMLIRLNVLNARVRDVAIPAHYGNEESSLSINRILTTFPLKLARGFGIRIWEKY